MNRLVVTVTLFVVFTAYTAVVAASHGYIGFLTLALAEPWALQMLLDLGVALSLFALWMFPDARRTGISPWPYLVAVLSLGSIGALAYLVHRELRLRAAQTRAGAAEPEPAAMRR